MENSLKLNWTLEERVKSVIWFLRNRFFFSNFLVSPTLSKVEFFLKFSDNFLFFFRCYCLPLSNSGYELEMEMSDL